MSNLLRACNAHQVTAYLAPMVSPCFHTSAVTCLKPDAHLPKEGWLSKNNEIQPPQKPGEERNPAWVCHSRSQIKYSPKKMWYIACLVRGLSIDEAIKQMSLMQKKGAQIIKEILLEAQELAVKEHNVEYKSNLWVGESFVGKGSYVKGLRKHARMRFGTIEYKYCHYFVRLVEGPPPKHYYPPQPNGHEKIQNYIQELRNRTIKFTL